MKKRIFTFLTLLVAFFGLIGLTTNNYKVINAAGNQSTVDSDLAAINIPETALISFPVTYKSVYGNDIDWSVEKDQTIITYDEEAHWMVVNRPTEGVDQEIDITVTVTGADNATATKTVTVTVPVGVTATRSFSITYDYGYENPVTVNNPEQYKLGQATIELLEPAREGYMFDGWYAGEQKVEKILVGSMQDYTLTAHWTQVAIDSIYVKTNPTKTTYNALETFDGAGIEVYAQYNNGEEEAIPFENLTFNKTTLHGNDNEVEVSYSGKTTTVSITVNKLDYAINKENFKDTSKEYNGQAQQIEYSGVLPEGLTATYTGSAKDVADGTVTITLSFTNANEIDYNTPEDLTAKLTILPKTITLTTTSKSIDLGDEISWTFTGGEFIEPDTISVVDLTKVTPTYKLNGQSVNPENFVTGQTYDVEFTGATADNYTVEIEPATLTINAVEVNLSAEALTYTGQEQTFVAIAKDASGQEITGGTFTYDGKATATGTNAGTYSIEVVFTHPSHPTVTKTIDFKINPKKVTITASDVTSVYGTLPELENKWSQEGILDADLDDFVVEVTTNATETSIPDTYETTANCTSTNSNYVVEYVNGTHTVTKKQVTVTVDETTITSVYGDTLATLKYKLAEGSSLVAGDEAEFSQLISLSTTATSNSNAGEYDITITADESNKYDIKVAEQLPKYVITPKDLTDLVEVTVNGSDWNIQDSTSLTPGVTVKYGELTITTYELTYEYANETIKVGQATITVEFNGNYTGEAEAQFLITENGLAVEDGKLLAQKYASVLTGTLTTIEQLDVEGTNGSTITWITDSTALSINSEGNVTITRPTGKDEEVILYAQINYGKSSEDVISFEFTVEGIYSLESTNVKIENIGSGYTLNAETIEEANLEQANFQISENEQYVTAYDISFTQGEDTNAQPGKVTVKLAVPEEYKDNEGLVIYHVKDDETSETISNYTFDGNYVVFEADSFSPYVVTIKTYKVTFLDKDGEVIETQTVKHGSSATAPDAPEVEGYTFKVWKGTYTNVKDNVTVESEYTVNKYTLTTIVDGEETKVTIEYGAAISVADPTKEGYEFTGWNPALPTTMPAEDVTVEAQFEEVENVETYDAWELVTDADELKAGDQIVIVAAGYDVAMSTTQNNNNRGNIEIIKLEDNKYIYFISDDVQILTLEAGTKEGTFAFNSGTGYLYAASTSSNYLRTEQTLSDNSSWTIEIANDGIATIKAQGANTINWLRYNNSNKIFSCYDNGQTDIVIYKAVDVVDNPYTTHTVTYVVDGEENSTETILSGQKATLPTLFKDGYELNGWYKNEALTGDLWDINSSVTEDITLYAEWKVVTSSSMSPTTYDFSTAGSGTQYAENEKHQLDSFTTLTINGAHLNTQVRLYSGSNAVISCTKTISSIEVKAGYKAGTLTIYVSNDGSTWTEVETISTTTSYTVYEVDLKGNYNYVKMESTGAQIRVSTLTINPNS